MHLRHLEWTADLGPRGPKVLTSDRDLGERESGSSCIEPPQDQPVATAVRFPCHHAATNSAQPFPEPLGRNLSVLSRGNPAQEFFEHRLIEAAGRSTGELDDAVRDVRSVEA